MKFSIVTPSFNQVRYLEKTLQSVLNNEDINIEYIVIDGGSTDGSIDIIKKYAHRLAYWCSEPDGGQYDAVNKGFQHATGDILAWVNSSDLYLPWTLPTVRDIFHKFPETQWVTSLMRLSVDGWGRFSGFCTAPGFSRNSFIQGLGGSSFIQQESCFWTRSLWDKIGGRIPDDYRFAGDFHLWSLFFEHAPLTGVDCPLAAFRYHASQRSHENRYTDEVAEILTALRQDVTVPPHNRQVPIVLMDGEKKQVDPLGPPIGDWSLRILPDDQSVAQQSNLQDICEERLALINKLSQSNGELRAAVASLKDKLATLNQKATLKKQASLKYQIKKLFKNR